MANNETPGLAEKPADFDELEATAARFKATASLHEQREIDDAAEYIRNKAEIPPQAKAYDLERAAIAITRGISVFISHRSQDSALANAFAETIRLYGQTRLCRNDQGQLDVFVAQQNVMGGENWRAKVENAIRRANWFILLLPDIEFGREWPVFEAGFFKRGMSFSEKLICVHHPQVARASQLKDYQFYQATPKGIRKMLSELFIEPNAIPGLGPIAIAEMKKKVGRDARELAKRFQAPQAQLHVEQCMSGFDILHEEGVRYETLDDLLNASVEGLNSVDDVFNRPNDYLGSFGDMIVAINDQAHGQGWIDGLRRQLNASVEELANHSMEVPFSGYTPGTAYRACLHCVERDGQHGPIVRFHVVLVPEFGRNNSAAPPEMDALETSLRWCYRSWWEILYQYRLCNSPAKVDEIRRYTERAEHEAQMRGTMDPELLLAAFNDDPETMAKLKEFQEEYYTDYRDPLNHQGKLDQAFENRDHLMLRQCLGELRPRVLWFMKEAAKRFAERLNSLN